MKKLKILIVVAVIIILCCSAVFLAYHMDISDHTGTLELQTEVAITMSGDTSDMGLSPGQEVPVEIRATNLGYSPMQTRQILVLSVYSKDGEPLLLNGSSWTTSALDLFDSTQTHSPFQPKVIQGNRAFYISEHDLGPAQKRIQIPFLTEQPIGENSSTAFYTLRMDSDPSEIFTDCIIVIDVIIDGRLTETADAWQNLYAESTVIGAESLSSHTIYNNWPILLTDTASFQWDVRDGMAYLTGIGSITDTDILIPTQVRLTEVSGNYIEDPFDGQFYDVVIAGDAFYDCDSVVSVTFQDGAVIENDLMYGIQGGMFESCDNLTAVYGVPNTVTEMIGTYKNCTALISAPVFPTSVTNINNCFEGCSSLTGISDLPNVITSMNSSFKDCTALVTISQFPQSVTDLDGCFTNCTSLAAVSEMPDTVINLNNCFFNCASLESISNLSASATSMINCFSGCSSLTQVPKLPDAVTDMTGCFTDCSSLTHAPELPDAVTNLRGCFTRCISLTTAPEIPSNVKSLWECFVGCSSLVQVGEIPNGVVNMDKCFFYCRSLTAAPEIPETVTTLRFCFEGCTSLSGVIKIPFIPYADGDIRELNDDRYFRKYSITDFVKGCGNIDVIQVNYCPGLINPATISTRIPVEFVGNHDTEGICDICRFVNLTTEIDGVEVVIDNIPENNYTQFIAYFDNEVPDWLKPTCSRITFTPDLGKYNPAHNSDTVQGFATFPFGEVYIKDQYSFSEIPYVIFHELAHAYDHNYSTYSRHSSSYAWIELHEQEGETAASLWYNKHSYDNLTKTEQRRETFAMAFGQYFTNPSALKRKCPGMYEYIHELFEENQ